jgi:hypothetical protein
MPFDKRKGSQASKRSHSTRQAHRREKRNRHAHTAPERNGTMAELEKLFELVKDHSWQSMEKEGGILPTFFCHVPNVDGCGVIPCLWDSPLQKHLMVSLVKAKFKELNIDRFGFYAESWITDRSGLAANEPTPQERSAERQECIFVYVEEKSGLSKSGYWPIREDGGKAELGDFVLNAETPTSTSMTFANMFGADIFH